MSNPHYFWTLIVVAIIIALAFGPAVVFALALIILGLLGIYMAIFYLYVYGVPGWLAVIFGLLVVALAIGVGGAQYSAWRTNVVGDLESHRVKARDGDATPNPLLLALIKLFHWIDL